MLTVINIAAYGILLVSAGALGFRDCPIFYRNGSSFPWFDWTYGQYLLIMAAMVLILGVAAGALALFLSQYSGSYVTMLLKAVPLFLVVGVLFSTWVMKYTFFIRHGSNGGQLYSPKGMEATCALILLAVSLALCAWTCFYQRHRELR